MTILIICYTLTTVIVSLFISLFFSDTNGTTGYFVMYRIKYIRKLKVIKTDHN